MLLDSTHLWHLWPDCMALARIGSPGACPLPLHCSRRRQPPVMLSLPLTLAICVLVAVALTLTVQAHLSAPDEPLRFWQASHRDWGGHVGLGLRSGGRLSYLTGDPLPPRTVLPYRGHSPTILPHFSQTCKTERGYASQQVGRVRGGLDLGRYRYL